MKKLTLSLIIFGLALINQSAKAITITFDDITTPVDGWNSWVVMPEGYAGFEWDNFEVARADQFNVNPKATNTDVSSPNVAYNGNGEVAAMFTSEKPFNFNEAYFSSWAYDDFTLKIEAFVNSGTSPIANEYLNLSQNNPVKFTFDNFNNINTLAFIPQTNEPAWFTVDNMNVTPAPEPGSLALGAMGIFGLIGIRRKK